MILNKIQAQISIRTKGPTSINQSKGIRYRRVEGSTFAKQSIANLEQKFFNRFAKVLPSNTGKKRIETIKGKEPKNILAHS